MAADGKSCDVTTDKRYDEPDAPHLGKLKTIRSFSYADTTSYRQDRWWPTVKARTRTGERKWHLELEGWALVQDMVGKPFVIWDDKYGSHGVCIDHSVSRAGMRLLALVVDSFGHPSAAASPWKRPDGPLAAAPAARPVRPSGAAHGGV
jgi:hypothetical protein